MLSFSHSLFSEQSTCPDLGPCSGIIWVTIFGLSDVHGIPSGIAEGTQWPLFLDYFKLHSHTGWRRLGLDCMCVRLTLFVHCYWSDNLESKSQEIHLKGGKTTQNSVLKLNNNEQDYQIKWTLIEHTHIQVNKKCRFCLNEKIYYLWSDYICD